MISEIQLGDITLSVRRKDIKNVHLSVHPPSGRVTVSAPTRMKMDTIRVYALSKLSWIKKQARRIQSQERETPREYKEQESHYLWGKRYLMRLVEKEAKPSVELSPRLLKLQVRPGASEDKRKAVIEAWYREQLKEAIPVLIDKWESMMKVEVNSFGIRKMKTRWGSCSPSQGSIRLNLELAKKPPQCLEYIVVNEMIHLMEPTHNKRFVSLMDHFMPHWRLYREALNRLPVSHQDWRY